MKYAIPEFARDRVNAAGRLLLNPPFLNPYAIDEALEIVNNWRAAHHFPLNTFHVTLRGRARRLDPRAVTAQRLKRLTSITAKLKRGEVEKLTQMQDIGGCRAVVASVAKVHELVDTFKSSLARNPTREFVHDRDYIANPKQEGYRSLHLIYRYRGTSDKHTPYTGLKIEIQIRSQLQHAWATAVETVSTFTGLPLKSGGLSRDTAWGRFFALMGSALALREETPLVPNTPTDRRELITKLRYVTEKLRVETVLETWRMALQELPVSGARGANSFLLVLDPNSKTLSVTPISKRDRALAATKYLPEAERQIKLIPGADAVLVSADSIATLKSAYPNYRADTRKFLNALAVALR